MTLTATRSRTGGLLTGCLTALTMTAVLAACSADDSGDSVSGESAGSSAGSSSAGGDRSAPQSDTEDTTEDTTDTTEGTTEDTAAPELQRSVISTGTVSLAGEDVRATRHDVQRVVDAQGGEVTDETIETDAGDPSYVRMVVRVPSRKFAETMSALEQVGDFRSSGRGSEDVTTEVIDTGARVRAQEASLRRVELLLAEARDLGDVIRIESQLTSRQAELDSLKSRQSWLADQTSLATITVDISLVRAVEDAPEEDRPAGFLVGLDEGSKALGALVTVLTTIVGALLPFAAVALVLGLPVWLLLRRRRSTTPGTPTT